MVIALKHKINTKYAVKPLFSIAVLEQYIPVFTVVIVTAPANESFQQVSQSFLIITSISINQESFLNNFIWKYTYCYFLLIHGFSWVAVLIKKDLNTIFIEIYNTSQI